MPLPDSNVLDTMGNWLLQNRDTALSNILKMKSEPLSQIFF